MKRDLTIIVLTLLAAAMMSSCDDPEVAYKIF